MKTTVYMRIGWDSKRRKAQVVANARPTSAPLTDGKGYYLPTVAFAVAFTVPEEMFKAAERVIAELILDEQSAAIAAEVKQ